MTITIPHGELPPVPAADLGGAERPPTSDTTVAELYALSSAVRTQRGRRARNLERQRADAIRQALADGWTRAQIAEATGLTRGRIDQLTRPTVALTTEAA